MGFQGLDLRQTGDRIVFRALLQTSAGAVLSTGTTELRIYELQNDGSLKTFDFNGVGSFTTGVVVTEKIDMTHRTTVNSTRNTGIWSYALTSLSAFMAGNIYIAEVYNSGASPTHQQREFQFGVSAAFDPFDATPDVNVAQLGGQTVSAAEGVTFNSEVGASVAAMDAFEDAFDGTGFVFTNCTIPTVTTLTNLPAITTNWLTADGIAADAGAKIAALVESYIVNEGDATAVMQAIADVIAADWIAGDASPLAIAAAVRTNLATELARIDTTISSRASAVTFNGITSLAQWLGAMASKQTSNSQALTEINLTGAGTGTFDGRFDSQEALRDRGDLAWVTATTVNLNANQSGVTIGTVNSATLANGPHGGAAATLTLSSYTNFRNTAVEMQNAVWNAPIANHQTLLTFGLTVSNIDSRTSTIQGWNGSQFTNIPWNAAWNTSLEAAVMDKVDGVETGITLRKAIKAISSASAGILSGAEGTEIVVKGINQPAEGTTRITATVDNEGNRTAVVLNL